MTAIALPRAVSPGRIKIGLLVLALLAGWALPYVAGPFAVATATLALIYGLFALSINLLAGYGGLLSLGHAGIFGVAAYGVGYIASRTEGGYGAQLFWGMAAGLAVSLIFGVMAMRTRRVYFLMVTLAQGMIVYGLAQSLEPVTGAENGLTGVYRPAFVLEDWQFYYLSLAVLAICAGLIQVVVRSPFGLALRGLADSDTRLAMTGYSVVGHRLLGFVLSGFFASIAGILYAYNNEYVSPSVAEFNTSAQAILMIILGGVGTLSGPVIGAFVIVFVQNVLSLQIERWPTVMGLIFILMVLFARNGFVGGVTRLWNRYVRRREEP
ncbi:MAG: branched-chain amino acid ABC transporter permease [Streptosporangiales bacterium]|nr:branched-chain amino acid ABC transporter permease [Streptosporangiales bacterium]